MSKPTVSNPWNEYVNSQEEGNSKTVFYLYIQL